MDSAEASIDEGEAETERIERLISREEQQNEISLQAYQRACTIVLEISSKLHEKRHKLEEYQLLVRKNSHKIQSLEARALELRQLYAELCQEQQGKHIELKDFTAKMGKASTQLQQLQTDNPFIENYK